MSQGELYRIVDEPRPSALSHLAVDPVWPFFALVAAGPWLAWPWFAFNAFAFGDERRWRSAAIALGGALLTAGLFFGIAVAASAANLEKRWLQYLFLAPVLLRLGVSYALFVSQQGGFALYRYFGGRARSGVLLVVAGYYAAGQLSAAVPSRSSWALLLAVFS